MRTPVSHISHIEDRFGYSETGKVTLGFKGEYILYSICLIMLIFGIVVIDIKMMSWSLYHVETALFYALITLIVCTFWAIAWVLLAKLVLSGFVCKYFCDRDKFTITILRHEQTFYYDEVVGVEYEDLTLLGRVRGYEVTVRTAEKHYHYRVVISSRTSSTAFGILEERAKHARRAQNPEPIPIKERFDERFMQEGNRQKNAEEIVGPIFPISHQQNTQTDELQAADKPKKPYVLPMEEMPTISASLSAENVIARLNAEMAEPHSPEQRPAPVLSPTVDPTAYRIGEETDENRLVAEGTYQTPIKYEVFASIGAFGVVFAIAGCITFCSLGPITDNPLTRICWFALMLILNAVGDITALRFVLSGEKVNYRANGKEFRITQGKGKKQKTTSLYYCDITRVDYTPIKLLFIIDRGYNVKITTKYRTYMVKWLLPYRRKFMPPHKTPFNIIVERIPPFEPLPKKDSKKKNAAKSV